MTFDDKYMLRLKSAKVSDKVIAAKLGITEDELQKRWAKMVAELSTALTSTYGLLVDQITVMANQYQLLGESLKIVCNAVGNQLSREELEALVVDNREQTLANLRDNCIILRPFEPVDPKKALEDSLRGN